MRYGDLGVGFSTHILLLLGFCRKATMSKMHSSHRMETPFQSSLLDSIPFLINHGIGRPTWLAELCEAPFKLKTGVEPQAEKARE